LALSGDAQRTLPRHTGGSIEAPKAAAMTITPTRLPGLRAALTRTTFACARALRRIPAWQGVSLVMACAAGAMVALSPGSLLA
jgi:hypothetical protein